MTVATVRRMGNSLGFTVPADEAKRLGLVPGDQVELHIQKVAPIASIHGMFKGKMGNVGALMRDIDEGEDD